MTKIQGFHHGEMVILNECAKVVCEVMFWYTANY